MIKPIIKDILFLQMKSEPATRADMSVVTDLLDTVKSNAEHCVGMAANMIGAQKTVLVALIGKEYIVMINPKIVDTSKQVYEAEEGCLSLVGTRPAKRYAAITVEYLDKKFKRKKQTFKDYEAQIIQHEIDHFNGIII